MPIAHAYYDGYRLYPVAQYSHCSNAGMCRFMLEVVRSRVCKEHRDEAWYEQIFDGSSDSRKTLKQLKDEDKAIWEALNETIDGLLPQH